ncbi:MAG: hypothetical protein KJ574_05440 [Nanoarchaeota archaeon]|nr:hypothetical protein [Nanoarchaeota archaeon]
MSKQAAVQQTSEMGVPPLEQMVLQTADGKFACFQIDGNSQDRRIIDEFKQYVKRKNERFGYEGFSFKIDDYFDPFSMYFYTRNRKGEIVATSRATLRVQDNILPFEMGIRPDGSKYILDEEVQVGDINSFAMSWGKSGMDGLMVLFAGLGRFMDGNDVKKVFCLLDEDNPVISQLYTGAGFEPSPTYDEKIVFPTYGKTVEGIFVPTMWRIMEMNPTMIKMYSDMAAQYERKDIS